MFSVYSAVFSSTCDKLKGASTQAQPTSKASLITTELASVASSASSSSSSSASSSSASGVSDVHFERRIKLLKELVASWKENEEVALVDVNPSKQAVCIELQGDEIVPIIVIFQAKLWGLQSFICIS